MTATDRDGGIEVEELQSLDVGAADGQVGIILGAGGIRGCAHAGVFKVMSEVGVHASVVVGASIGSMFGAAYAAGWDAGRIARLADAAPRRAVAEFYLNRLRIDRSTYIGAILCQLGEKTRIEDLPRTFACMAFDCATGDIVALRNGPLLKSIEASIALPGIAKPVVLGSRTYLDGGLRGPVAAELVRTLGATIVIRVELVDGGAGHRPASRCRATLGSALRWAAGGRRFGDTAATGVGTTSPATPQKQAIETMPLPVRTDADITIAPRFSGLLCNAPLGIRFCSRRGEAAAREALLQLPAGVVLSPTAVDDGKPAATSRPH